MFFEKKDIARSHLLQIAVVNECYSFLHLSTHPFTHPLMQYFLSPYNISDTVLNPALQIDNIAGGNLPHFYALIGSNSPTTTLSGLTQENIRKTWGLATGAERGRMQEGFSFLSFLTSYCILEHT